LTRLLRFLDLPLQEDVRTRVKTVIAAVAGATVKNPADRHPVINEREIRWACGDLLDGIATRIRTEAIDTERLAGLAGKGKYSFLVCKQAISYIPAFTPAMSKTYGVCPAGTAARLPAGLHWGYAVGTIGIGKNYPLWLMRARRLRANLFELRTWSLRCFVDRPGHRKTRRLAGNPLVVMMAPGRAVSPAAHHPPSDHRPSRRDPSGPWCANLSHRTAFFQEERSWKGEAAVVQADSEVGSYVRLPLLTRQHRRGCVDQPLANPPTSAIGTRHRRFIKSIVSSA